MLDNLQLQFWTTFLLAQDWSKTKPEALWNSFETLSRGACSIEKNWRGYWYTRIFPIPSVELVVCLFPPGSYTGIHDHESYNFNFVICGEVEEKVYRSSNGKFRPAGERLIRSRSFSVIMPYQPHEMIASSSSSAMTVNFHCPERPFELTKFF